MGCAPPAGLREDASVDKELSGPGETPAARNVPDDASVAALLARAMARGIPRLDAEVLLAALARQPRSQLIAFPEQQVDALTAAMFTTGLQRLRAGEPLAYITGVREFWSLPLVVAPAVLVPRPETELLVELCLARYDAAPRRVADLGTGCGAIALALAKERPAWWIIATDYSSDALQIAQINRERLKLGNVELRHGRWCDALGSEPYDAILSNPPYVAAGHPALAALRHEPIEALVAEDDGYADLLAIAAGARSRLKPGGMLLLEHGFEQATRLAGELARLGYSDIHCHQDLAGLDRATAAIWP
jgi:release factor glutamine methyltransferase